MAIICKVLDISAAGDMAVTCTMKAWSPSKSLSGIIVMLAHRGVAGVGPLINVTIVLAGLKSCPTSSSYENICINKNIVFVYSCHFVYTMCLIILLNTIMNKTIYEVLKCY